MKKLIITLLVLAPFATFGATQTIKQLKSYDFIASVETNTGNVFIYKIEDKDANCFVMTNDHSINSRVNGANFGISCVVKPVK